MALLGSVDQGNGPHCVRALGHTRRMRGGSQSHLMRCADNAYYVVKFQGNPQGTGILANEFFGTQLAERLGLPTTPFALCYVSEELIQLTPDLCVETPSGRIPCLSGLQFGSRYPLDPRRVTIWNSLSDRQLMEVENLRDFRGMLVFDKWTCNTDGRQTIFYQSAPNAPHRAVMIDQGFCFNGADWDFPDGPLRGLYSQRVVYKGVRHLDDFEPWLITLEREIDETVLMDLAKSIPPEWHESNWDSLQFLLERLELRRSRVRELLWATWKSSREAFPSWNCTLALGQAASSRSTHVPAP